MSTGKWMISTSIVFAILLAAAGYKVGAEYDGVLGLGLLLLGGFPFLNVLFWSRVTIQWVEE